MTILPSITDKQMKKGYRSEILKIENGKAVRIAFVYGDTLKELRARKQIIYNAFSGKKESGHWKGPRNTIEKFWWIFAGEPPEDEWMKVKWKWMKKKEPKS